MAPLLWIHAFSRRRRDDPGSWCGRDLDLRNFVGIEDGPRPGFTAIRVHGRAKARNASKEQLDELCRYVQKTSPVGDIIANPVPVEVSLTVG